MSSLVRGMGVTLITEPGGDCNSGFQHRFRELVGGAQVLDTRTRGTGGDASDHPATEISYDGGDPELFVRGLTVIDSQSCTTNLR